MPGTRSPRTRRAWASWTSGWPSTAPTARSARPGGGRHVHRHRPDAHVRRHRRRPGPALSRDPGLDGRAGLDDRQRLPQRPRPDRARLRRDLPRATCSRAPSPSRAASADVRNNVESVFLPAGTSGTLHRHRHAPPTSTRTACPTSAALSTRTSHSSSTTASRRRCRTWWPRAPPSAAENCGGGNGAIDPGETATVNLSLANTGTGDTTNLVATLQSSGGVLSPSGPQSYGVLAAGGPAASRPFTLTAAGTCGGSLVATLQLQDGATDLGHGELHVHAGRDGAGRKRHVQQRAPPSRSRPAARARPTRRRSTSPASRARC